MFVAGDIMAGLLVLLHNGLGDHLACNGLVRTLASREKSIVLVCKLLSAKTLKYMYRDLSNVHLLPIRDDSDISPRFGADPAVLQGIQGMGFSVLLVGLHRGPLAPGSGFLATFHDQAAVDRQHRYSHFHVDRDLCIEQTFTRQPNTRYVFIHDDADRGLHIHIDTRIPIVRPGKADQRPHSDNIFAFVGLMEGAEELHHIDSAYAHMADLLDILPGRRYLHANVKNPGDCVEELFLRPGWNFVR